MSLLLDTHVLLWCGYRPEVLAAPVRARIADSSVRVYASAASAWEIAIKRRLGKLTLDIAAEDLLRALSIAPLPIGVAHAEAAGALPWDHRDPFDRMLVAQARAEGLTLVTADQAILTAFLDCLAAR
ncbi:MAG: type II toxin-antitoxin system VapC family toxin [Marivibrio sp.]|uniref:type II toxin-antitoxin system VapC family toxin n=1 Tax=Marivibrio sp. TaxID=2039719 RepID=UPI0032EB8EA8